MANIAKLISFAALALTIVPSGLYFTGVAEHASVKWIALVGTVAWFIATPLWMGRALPEDSSKAEA